MGGVSVRLVDVNVDVQDERLTNSPGGVHFELNGSTFHRRVRLTPGAACHNAKAASRGVR